MQYSIEYEDSINLHIVKTKGRMNGEGFVAMAQDILNHQKWQRDNNILFDHRDLEFDRVLPDDLKVIRSFHKKNEAKIGDGKTAILVGPGLIQKWYMLWSQGERIQTGNVILVFEDYEIAFQWLIG